MSDIVLVLTTVTDDDRAEGLARQLIDERLAACVNLHSPMVSFYRWKGNVERGAERQVVMKTTRDRLFALEKRLSEIHPYEVPEFVVLPVEDGSDVYLRWVRDETRS